MRYAIYSRKSKFTGKGDSIANQVEMCREHIDFNYRDDKDKHVEVFEDEGFSGKNTKRPEFQRMMQGVKNKQFDVVVCYRLDRLSRSVGDFSDTYNEFTKNKVQFASLTEKFDTTTPIGEAMMQISIIFSQMERHLVGERVRDNMLMLARSGRWLGGITPLGFQSTQEAKETVDGKVRTSYKLASVREQQNTVKQIFAKYLEAEALVQVETWAINRGLRSREGKYFTPIALREILSNPVYCVADEATYQYFFEHGSSVCGEVAEFDGKHGISAYNRTGTEKDNTDSPQKKKPISEWIIAVGKHRGIINSADWLKTQQLLERNRHLSWSYLPQNSQALLGSVFKCTFCGSRMEPRSSGYLREDGTPAYHYTCQLKVKSKKGQCKCPNINGNELDKKVCKEILSYREESSIIAQRLTSLKSKLENRNSEVEYEIKRIDTQIATNQRKIKKLIDVLSESKEKDAFSVHTREQVNAFDEENTRLKQERFQLEQSLEVSNDYDVQVDTIVTALNTFAGTFHTASVSDKRDFLKSIIERIEWDGNDIHIFLHGES